MKRVPKTASVPIKRTTIMPSEGLVAIVLLFSFLAGGCGKNEPSANAGGPPPIAVRLLEIKPEMVENVSEFSGSLTATQRVELKSEVQGQVEEILVKPGSRVTKGTIVMRLRPDKVSPQLQNAQAQVNTSKMALENAVQQLKVAESQREIGKANFELARTNYERAQQLVNQGAIGQITADQAKNQLDAATNAVKASANQVKVARKAVTQAQAGVRQAEAQLAFITANLQFRQIVSPMNGVVSELPLKSGESVSSGETLVTITQNNTMELRLPVPDDNSAQLRPGLAVELVDPNTQDILTTGKIHSIAPKATGQAKTILVKAQFANTNGKLQDGQYVQARIVWSKTPGILVPNEAVSRSGTQSFVFVAQKTPCEANTTTVKANPDQPQVICRRVVELGDTQGKNYQVRQGLKTGDRIAISNLLKLKDDVPIQAE